MSRRGLTEEGCSPLCRSPGLEAPAAGLHFATRALTEPSDEPVAGGHEQSGHCRACCCAPHCAYAASMVEVSALLVSLIGLIIQGRDHAANNRSGHLKKSLFALNEFAQAWASLARDLRDSAANWQSAGYPVSNDFGFVRALDKKQLWLAKERLLHADIEPLLEVYASELESYNRLLELKARSQQNLRVLSDRFMNSAQEDDRTSLDADLRGFYARTDEVLLAVEHFRKFIASTYPLADQ